MTVTLLAQVDWNDDGLNEWLLLCRVKPLIGKNHMRDYYLLIEKPGASIPRAQAPRRLRCLSQSCRLFVDVDQKKPPYTPEEPTIEVKIGQKDVHPSPEPPRRRPARRSTSSRKASWGMRRWENRGRGEGPL